MRNRGLASQNLGKRTSVLHSEFRISDFGFRIPDFEFRVSNSGFRIPESEMRNSELGLAAQAPESRIPRPEPESRDQNFVSRVPWTVYRK